MGNSFLSKNTKPAIKVKGQGYRSKVKVKGQSQRSPQCNHLMGFTVTTNVICSTTFYTRRVTGIAFDPVAFFPGDGDLSRGTSYLWRFVLSAGIFSSDILSGYPEPAADIKASVVDWIESQSKSTIDSASTNKRLVWWTTFKFATLLCIHSFVTPKQHNSAHT